MNKFWEKFFFILTYVCQGSSYLSAKGYAILHRMHHAYSDTELDPHSPHHSENLFDMMWKTKNIYNDCVNENVQVEERFTKDIPHWEALDKFASSYWSRVTWGTFYVMVYFLAITVWELPGTHWAMYGLLPIHFLMGPIHGAIVNWSGHKYGYANFDNNDQSKNSLILDFLMMGELFQNNHHKLPNRTNFAVKWYEFDPTYPLVKLLSILGIIKLNKANVS
jgi:stearoyl-CoA desaturase (Delta-9 desaturase)